jgi:hypothetical protein
MKVKPFDTLSIASPFVGDNNAIFKMMKDTAWIYEMFDEIPPKLKLHLKRRWHSFGRNYFHWNIPKWLFSP